MNVIKTKGVGLAILVFCAGIAALSWELLWQHYASLTFGVSAEGTAITLATTMGGMTVGSFLMGALLSRQKTVVPLRLYALLEGIIGVSGLLLKPGFTLLSYLDGEVYRQFPALASLFNIIGVSLLLSLPAMAMGATIPVIGLLARNFNLSLARLYAINTAGAALGVYLLAFVFFPNWGVIFTTTVISIINFSVALFAIVIAAWIRKPKVEIPAKVDRQVMDQLELSPRSACVAVFLTGFVTFTLEVIWFRSIRAAFSSTTEVFALVLFAVLVSLALGAALANRLRKLGVALSWILFLAGCLILIATPLIERFDLFARFPGNYWVRTASWLGLSLGVMGPPILVIGVTLPWILDLSETPKQWALYYGLNTLGAITGSIFAAWVLLPTIGSSRTAWFTALLLLLFAFGLMQGRKRFVGLVLGGASLFVAIAFDSGVGRYRAQGRPVRNKPHQIIEIHEGADVTSATVDTEQGRILLIDGFTTTGETDYTDYMDWMGRLPMLMHPDPKEALVICFGTGRTAHAVRDEEPEQLDIVDINPAVFAMAKHFTSNHGVLDDPRVQSITMDGRAWLRRTNSTYDIITLEPMPPNFAGSNALYAQEFYEVMATRLKEGAIVAQWLPFHLVTPEHSVYITAAFQAVFEQTVLWVEPRDGTGILLGRWGPYDENFGATWPGFSRHERQRLLTREAVQKAIRLNAEECKRYASMGFPVTDDNQSLSYGHGKIQKFSLRRMQTTALNFELIDKVKQGAQAP